ncbi:MAG: PIN domain-containing protein [archaeon]
MEKHERELSVIRKKGDEIKEYYNHEINEFIVDEDIIGFDANILVDMVDSSEFKEEIRVQVNFGVLKIYTTKIALGEARHVLIRDKDYSYKEATDSLTEILDEFNIESIKHDKKFNEIADKWINTVKKKMFIKKFSTFPNDCKILSNLIGQKNINLYFTEDTDIKKASKILELKVRVREIPEASNLSNKKANDFYFKGKSNYPRKKRKPF